MTQEEKQLLVKDICARIPFGLKCTTKAKCWQGAYPIRGYLDDKIFLDCPEYDEGDDEWLVQNIVPYLRPMISMTEEEWVEYCDACLEDEKSWVMAGNKEYKFLPIYNKENYLNSHHFDYRNLIDKGLALEAPTDMYNTKQ